MPTGSLLPELTGKETVMSGTTYVVIPSATTLPLVTWSSTGRLGLFSLQGMSEEGLDQVARLAALGVVFMGSSI